MIYPEFFPEDRNAEHAEKKVFEALSSVSGRYDIFYSRRFVEAGEGKKPEYEIDFIIAIPEQAILCLEVKGGAVNYDGVSDRWTQNRRAMDKRPDSQASAASHALTRRFSAEVSQMPVGWGLCFPDCRFSMMCLSLHRLIEIRSSMRPPCCTLIALCPRFLISSKGRIREEAVLGIGSIRS